MTIRNLILSLFIHFFTVNQAYSKVTLKEVRTASDNVIVAFFVSDTVNIEEVGTSDLSQWKINGQAAKSINKYVMQANSCNHHIYIETEKLVKGKKYKVETPFGNKDFTFNDREIFCESIKNNQVGYSAFSKTRYANFAIWLGTGGSRKIEGELPEYEVFETTSGKTVLKGKLKEIGDDVSAGGFVYRIDLSAVPEGGPYKIVVEGFGSSYPFGVGGEFSKMLAHTLFRTQYLQRCGCPINEPEIRKHACHTLIYDVDGPIGEANIDVVGYEQTFKMYGGYHDAGDADRRAYHISNPILNLMIFEAFPEYFTDEQYRIPGEFDKDFNILSYKNNIPDIIDEAEWGTLAWEYLQNEDGSIHFGTETRHYPDPFAAPLDLDKKKYGTVKVDDRATCAGAGLFLHLARIIQPYKPEKAAELIKRGELAMQNSSERMADPEKLYYHVQRYLIKKEDADHQKIRELCTIADSMQSNLFITPGYSLNDKRFDNPAYILSYILAKNVPTDPTIVDYFKKAIKNGADKNLAELENRAFPVGNNPAQGGWGHNVRQPQYAALPLLQWKLTKEQKYFDAASELMDYKTGLNPIGISYITALGFHQVHNIHDRESAYTQSLGWDAKPGITAFGPGVVGRRSNAKSVPAMLELPKERQFTDDRAIISFTEFTIFETMHYDALYTILSGGGKWGGKNPFELK
jgi:endoglucanase